MKQKSIWKNYLIITSRIKNWQIAFLLIILAGCSGCEFFDIDYDTYTIRNESDYSVTIKAYYHNEKFDKVKMVDSLEISSGDSYYIEKQTGEDSQEVGYFSSAADSAVIIFNSTKKLIYTCNTPYELENDINNCIDSRNIIAYVNGDYEWDSKRKGYDYEYIITNEDYNLATMY